MSRLKAIWKAIVKGEESVASTAHRVDPSGVASIADTAKPRIKLSTDGSMREVTGPLNDAITALQPKRLHISQLDPQLEALRLQAKKLEQIDVTVVSNRTPTEVRDALMLGQKISPTEFKKFASAQRGVALETEYQDTVKALHQITLSGKRTNTEELFKQISAIRKDQDFVHAGTATSNSRTVNGIEKDFFAGKQLDEKQLEKLRAFYNKHYYEGVPVSSPTTMMGSGTMGGQIVSVAKQLLDKMNDGKSVGMSISRAIEGATGISWLPRARIAVPAALAVGVAGTNVDYVFNGPSKPGLSIAQLVPAAALINFEPDLSEAAQLNFMAFQRNPQLLTAEKGPDGQPNKFRLYMDALKNNDQVTMQRQGLTKDQQDAIARITLATKAGIDANAEKAKANAAADQQTQVEQQADVALRAQNSVLGAAGRDRSMRPEDYEAAARGSLNRAETQQRLNQLGGAMGILNQNQIDAIAKSMAEASGGAPTLNKDAQRKVEATVDAQTASMAPDEKATVKKYLLAPAGP